MYIVLSIRRMKEGEKFFLLLLYGNEKIYYITTLKGREKVLFIRGLQR